MQRMAFFKSRYFFISRKAFLSIYNISKHFFLVYFDEKQRRTKSTFLTKIMGEKMLKMVFFKGLYFYSLEGFSIDLEH